LDYLINFAIAFFSCLTAIWLLYPFAIRIRLVDSPSERKTHTGEIPLIGGVSMFIGFVTALVLLVPDLNQVHGILIASTIIIIVGVLDDHRDISVRSRFILQIIAVLIMTSLSGVSLNSLGNLFGDHEILMHEWAIPFTVIAAVGAMNAMNMIDGVDGLAGATALICLFAVSVLYLISNDFSLTPLLLVGVLIPFLWFNLCNSRKIFMGDAGSMFLGFAIVWVLIEASQSDHAVMSPVTALWLFAIPLIDTVAIMFRRILKGQSPFLPDREHLHHIFLRAGFSDRATLYILSMLATLFSAIGIIGYVYHVPEWVMFFGFMLIFVIYLWGIRHAWKVLRYIRAYIHPQNSNNRS